MTLGRINNNFLNAIKNVNLPMPLIIKNYLRQTLTC